MVPAPLAQAISDELRRAFAAHAAEPMPDRLLELAEELDRRFDEPEPPASTGAPH